MIYNVQDASIPYSELSLNKPMVIHGNHLMKMMIKRDVSMPFYVQLPECKMIKSAKKRGVAGTGAGQCDLIFAEDEIASMAVIDFAEKLEEKSREMILENRSWFDTDLEASDIEQFFIPTLKWSRANKNYSWKGINIASNLTIYNDSGERGVEIEDVNADTRMICILEIRGIRFSAKSFLLESEIKQILVTQNTPLFEKCLIKPKTVTIPDESKDGIVLGEDAENKHHSQNVNVENVEDDGNGDGNGDGDATDTTIKEDEPVVVLANNPEIGNDSENNMVEDDLEITVHHGSEETPIRLKTRTEVYKKMYEDAIKRATNAKRVALLAYLEAKKIKKTYMLLENMQTDDSDDVNEEEEEEERNLDKDSFRIS
jgi:hypothetical protein